MGPKAISLFVGSSVKTLGLSVEHASLVVNERAMKTIASVASEQNVLVLGCRVEGSDLTIVHNFKVWWHGLGERSLVEMLVPKVGGWGAVAKIELNRSDVSVISYPDSVGGGKIYDTCLTIKTDALFDVYSDKPNQLGVRKLT